ncbi:MAG: CarD family transcriptional regulator [Clostridia bacterium]|nr:CarD family transcriptional regulator [Clostridia bacterium]
MYSIGDSIVYPLHGAGIIEAIEEREVSGLMHRYYAMRIPLGDMKVLIPIDGAEKIGVRDVINADEADKVIEEFRGVEIDANLNWNKRYRENMTRIKSGNIYEVASVVKSLMMRDKEKGLSTGERKMLANAKQILISEIVMSKQTTYAVVDQQLKDIVEEQILQKPKAE